MNKCINIMSKIRHYGIKFPTTIKMFEKTLLDLGIKISDDVHSDLFHLIFISKGQRVRHPDFNTSLIQFIFNLNNFQARQGIKSELKKSVMQFIPNTFLNDIEIYETDNRMGLTAAIKFIATENGEISTYQM